MVETSNGNVTSTSSKLIINDTNPSNLIINDHYNPTVRVLQIPKTTNGSCGFHLSRSKWDPYPWVSAVDHNTPAEINGLKAGDCVLEVNGEDVLGLRITEVANLVKSKSEHVTLLLWSTGMDPSCDPESLCCGPMPLNLERLSASMQTILTALECPVCIDTIPPPVIQCQNGHLICAKCRIRSEKCPICRERYSPGRSLIAEQIYNSITDAFNLRIDSDGKLRERLFGAKCNRRNKLIKIGTDINIKISQSSPTNKFLAKIMGKATSMENLCIQKTSNQLDAINSKQLSLSTNDISKRDNLIAIPRCPSMNRLNPDVSFIQNGQLLRKRPMSLNTSAEYVIPNEENNHQNNNNNGNDSEMSLSLPVPKRIEEKIFYCPSNGRCEKKFNGKFLQQHVKVQHNSPILSLGLSSVEISLPLRAPIEDASIILVLDNKQFWIKLRIDNDGSIFTSSLLQGFEDESLLYMLEVKIKNRVDDKLLERELITRSIVYSLMSTSWNDVLDKRLGVFYDQNSIKTTFINENELLLRADIKRRDE